MLPSDLPKTPGIYKIFFLDPEAIYIGQTVHLRKRCQNHLQDLRKGTHRNSHMQRAYDKYGLDAFHFEIVEHVEQRERLTEREQYYLDLLKPYYNICPIANTPPLWSPEKKQRLSQINKGKRMSVEARARMSAAKTGKPSGRAGSKLSEVHRARLQGKRRSEESKARMSAAHIGKPPPNKGKPMSIEQRQKLSEAHKGKPTWNKGKNLTPEHIAKSSAANKGRIPWNKGRKSDKPAWNKGKPTPLDVVAKVADAKRGKPSSKKGTHLRPEIRARAHERRLATLATKKTIKQPSLRDDEPAS